MYVILTFGQGDLDISIVNQEVWNFVQEGKPFSEETLEQLLNEEAVDEREYIKSCYEDLLEAGGSSPQNDRALFMMGRLNKFIHSFKELLDYLKQHPEVEIEDTYEGYIY